MTKSCFYEVKENVPPANKQYKNRGNAGNLVQFLPRVPESEPATPLSGKIIVAKVISLSASYCDLTVLTRLSHCSSSTQYENTNPAFDFKIGTCDDEIIDMCT